jgi:hypothetical protein
MGYRIDREINSKIKYSLWTYCSRHEVYGKVLHWNKSAWGIKSY